MAHIRHLIGGKPYHSIGHLPGSRLGPGDHHLSEQEAAFFTSRWDNGSERIAVTEKLDGSCVAILRQGDRLLAVNRAGHLVETSPYEQHHRVYSWMLGYRGALLDLLGDGDLLVGEWMAQAHGIIYDRLPDLFFAFDLRRNGRWLPTMELFSECIRAGIRTVPLVSYGPPLDPRYFGRLTKRSAFRSKGPAEGLVLRRENAERRLSIAKWVRADHRPGIYLPEAEDALVNEPVWHEIAV